MKKFLRLACGLAGVALAAATIVFLPSFVREFYGENKDVLGTVALPSLALSTAGVAIAFAVNRLKRWMPAVVVVSAWLVAAWYVRAMVP